MLQSSAWRGLDSSSQEQGGEVRACLVLGAQLLLERPAPHVLVVVRARVLVQLVQEEAAEEVAPGAQTSYAPLHVSVLQHDLLRVKIENQETQVAV